MPKRLIGWIAFAIVVVVVWKNPSGTGHFLFTTVPDKVSAFVGSIG